MFNVILKSSSYMKDFFLFMQSFAHIHVQGSLSENLNLGIRYFSMTVNLKKYQQIFRIFFQNIIND